jgi:hypothetical protein
VSISEEIRASAAAHRDLGPNYDTAVAEGLVERIGEEIDRRIDARLYGSPTQNPFSGPMPAPAPRQPPQPPQPRSHGTWRLSVAPVVLALGSMGMAIGASGVVLHPGGGSPGSPPLVALIWLVVGAINIAFVRRR